MSSDGGFHCPPKYRSRARESTGSWSVRGSIPNSREILPNPAGSAAGSGLDFWVGSGQRSQGGFGKFCCGPARQPAGFCDVFGGRAQRPADFCAFWRRPPQQPGLVGEFFRHWLRGQTPSCDFCPGWLPRPSQTVRRWGWLQQRPAPKKKYFVDRPWFPHVFCEFSIHRSE